MPPISLCRGIYCWQGPVLKNAKTPLENTNFPFVSGYQREIASALGVWACVHVPSALGPYQAQIWAGHVQVNMYTGPTGLRRPYFVGGLHPLWQTQTTSIYDFKLSLPLTWSFYFTLKVFIYLLTWSFQGAFSPSEFRILSLWLMFCYTLGEKKNTVLSKLETHNSMIGKGVAERYFLLYSLCPKHTSLSVSTYMFSAGDPSPFSFCLTSLLWGKEAPPTLRTIWAGPWIKCSTLSQPSSGHKSQPQSIGHPPKKCDFLRGLKR